MLTPQLRGKHLDNAIKDSILKLAKGKKNFKLNQTKLASVVGTSRAALNSRKDYIEEILNGIKATKRESDGRVEFEQMQMKIDRLEKTISVLKKENDSLRKDHIEIYGSLTLYSVKASKLIEPIIHEEINRKGKCFACNQKVNAEVAAKNSNVVSLKKNR